MAAPVTLKMIAERAGVHLSTVSLALRKDPRLAEKTRVRICRIAEEMGYEPNAMMKALCSYREANRPHPVRSAMAYLTDLPSDSAFHQVLYRSACRESERLGYNLIEYNLNAPGSSLRHCQSVWWNTGIKGVIIGPFRNPETRLTADWDRWVTVAYGYSIEYPRFNRIVHDHFHNMLVHLGTLRARGYRRIGLILSKNLIGRTDGLIYAAYLLDSVRNGGPGLQPNIDNLETPRAIKDWVHSEQLDAVIGLEPHYAALLEAGFDIPGELGFSLLSWRDYAPVSPPECAGYDNHAGLVAAKAVSFLVAQIHEQAYGVPEVSLHLHVAGAFHEGATIRQA